MTTTLNSLRDLLEAALDDDYEAAVKHGKMLVNAFEEEGCPSQSQLIRMLKSCAKDFADYVEDESIEDLNFEPEEEEEDIEDELNFDL